MTTNLMQMRLAVCLSTALSQGMAEDASDPLPARKSELFGIMKVGGLYSIMANLAIDRVQPTAALTSPAAALDDRDHPENVLSNLRKAVLDKNLAAIEASYPDDARPWVEKEYAPAHLDADQPTWTGLGLKYRAWFGSTVLLGCEMPYQGAPVDVRFTVGFSHGHWQMVADWPINHLSCLIADIAMREGRLLPPMAWEHAVVVSATIARKPEITLIRTQRGPSPSGSLDHEVQLQLVLNGYEKSGSDLADAAQADAPNFFMKRLADDVLHQKDVGDAWRSDPAYPRTPQQFLDWSESGAAKTEVFGSIAGPSGPLFFLHGVSCQADQVYPLQVTKGAGTFIAQEFIDDNPDLSELLFHKVALRNLLMKALESDEK